MRRRLRALCLVGVVVLSRALAAQATPFVAPTDRVYRDIDRLAASGLIVTLIAGTRPFSEREVRRLLNEAKSNLGRQSDGKSWAAATVRRDLALFARAEPEVADAFAIEAIHFESPNRTVPADSNGMLPAQINPLGAYAEGRTNVFGQTASLETFHSVLVGSHVSLSLNPRLATRAVHDANTATTGIQLQSGFANFLFGNLSIEGGRDYAVFGQAPNGGLLLSDNAPPLNMVRVSNDRPAAFPWLLGLLGPMRGTLLVADLGGSQLHPHAKLAGYHIAALPHPRFEIGVEVIDAMGGKGGLPATFGDRLLDMFQVRRDSQFSNRLAAADLHWRMPSWAGFEFYGQAASDDFDVRQLETAFSQDGSYLVGAALTCLAECGRFGIRAEYHQTGIRFYTHPDYPIEQNGFLLGDPLGPRGVGGYVTVDGDAGWLGHIAVNGAMETRSGNGYGVTGDNATGFHFPEVFQRPAERRARATVTWSPDLVGDFTSMRLTSGAERVTNFGFVDGVNRVNWLASAGIVVR